MLCTFYERVKGFMKGTVIYNSFGNVFVFYRLLNST